MMGCIKETAASDKIYKFLSFLQGRLHLILIVRFRVHQVPLEKGSTYIL